jgi:outer membrane cobalamin receptor
MGEEKMKNLLRILILLGVTASAAFAEDGFELEKIVVTPSRYEQPHSKSGRKVNIISGAQLSQYHYKGLSEALDEIASVNIRDYGNLGAQKTIQMRGATASQVLVMVDGRPINSPRSGDLNLNTLPLENIERVEIMRGSGSSLYGSSAMGGIVNIITKKITKDKPKTELSSSFGTYRTYIDTLTHTGKIGRFGYLVATDYQSTESHRDHNEYDAKNFSDKLEYEISDSNKITLNSGFHKSKLETPGTITAIDINDYQIQLQNFIDLTYDFTTPGDIGGLLKIYQNYDRLEFIERPDPLDKTTHTTKSRGLDIQLNREIFDFYHLLCGFNYVGNFNDSTSTAKHEYNVRAGYLENRLELLEKLHLNFGARIDDYSNFGTELNPSAGLSYDVNADTAIHILIARSFRPPTFNDLYWPSGGGLEGNPNLKPEKGISGEFGIRGKISKYLQTDLTYFRSDYDNLIKWTEDSDSVWRPHNFDSAGIQGIELENKIILTDDLELQADYTYLRAKDKKTHKYLIYQPKYKANFSLIHKNICGFKLGLRYEFVDRRFHDTANSIYVKRYYTLGVDVSRKIKDATIFLSVNNLLDKKYEATRGYPMPGFSVTSGFKLEF